VKFSSIIIFAQLNIMIMFYMMVLITSKLKKDKKSSLEKAK